MRISCSIFAAAFFILLLSGCGEREELETQAFVVAIGLDKAEDDNLVDVTFQIANPQVNTLQTAEAQNEPSSDIVTVTAPDLLAAKELVQTSHSRKVTFAHLETFIVEEDLARSDLFHNIMGSAIVDPEVRRESVMIISREKASKFIHANKPTMETRPHKYYEFMEKRWEKTGLVPLSNLNIFFHRVDGELFLAIYATTEREEVEKRNEDTYLAGEVPQKSGDPVQMIGSAIIQNRKMIGTLDGEETRLSLLLRRKSLLESMVASFPDPVNKEFRISVRMMRNGNTKVKVDTNREPAKVQVKVPVRLQITSNPGLVSYTMNEEKQKILKQSIKENLERSSLKLIKKMQNEYKGEPFVWYVPARKNFWTVKQFEKYDWEKHFQDADIDVQYDVMIENFGEQIRPPVK